MQSISAKAAENTYDLAVIGGGVTGLWTAFYAARQGLSVVLIEKRGLGAGASGGVMGALMPHQPTGWDGKKQFQLDGLLALEEEIAELEDFTGLSAGYRRCGRLMPVRAARKRPFAENWARASETNWPHPFRWRVLDETPLPRWLPSDTMPFGANYDDLSARVDPRKLLAALAEGFRRHSVDIRENTAVETLDPDGTVRLANGDRISAGHIVLATGWQSFALIGSGFEQSTGTGVKGQAALLRPGQPVDPAAPILYDDGVYVIAHDSGDVAVGSTSENSFDDPGSTDEKLDAVIAAAKALSPALEGAATIERWAGIRPKAAGRDPLVGPLPGFRNTFLASGGFKIGFGIAHLMAKAVLAQIEGGNPAFLPESFLPETRLRSAEKT
jgi:glycine/D-amino acid oxidase-like deaminating enzyme